MQAIFPHHHPAYKVTLILVLALRLYSLSLLSPHSLEASVWLDALNTLALLMATTRAHKAFYPRAYKGLGIEYHFQNVLFPLVLLAGLDGVVAWLGGPRLALQVILLASQSITMAIGSKLIRFHSQDRDTTPPSYFAADLYLQDSSSGS